MSRKLYPFERLEASISPLPSLPKPASRGFARQPSSSSDGKISPIVLLVIVILAVIFFFCGLLHLLVRFLMKRPSFYSFSRYPSNPDSSSSDALHRQLQQLFRLHDSGLDQAIIDSLPVFCYKDIVGSKEPFDCPVCLCEFSDQDKLRLLPDCGHAFHISCIDTWLLSNSTCPLCRGMLVCSGGYSMENRLISLDYFMDLSHMQPDDGDIGHKKPTIMEESAGERRVYSVRLGKFRTVNHEEVGSTQIEHGETSSSNLDARRCFSLGSCQYVIADSDLLVSFSDSLEADVGNKGIGKKLDRTKGWIGNTLVDGDVEAKRISSNSKGESFSVSKIWQWSKKGKFPSSSNTNLNQLTKKDEIV